MGNQGRSLEDEAGDVAANVIFWLLGKILAGLIALIVLVFRLGKKGLGIGEPKLPLNL